MKAVFAAVVLVSSALLALGYSRPQGPHADPVSAESQGMDPVKLDAMARMLQSKRTSAFVVVKDGQIVKEWYGSGYDADSRFGTASMAKALVGGIALLKMVDAGYLDIDDHVHEYIPQWKEDPLKAQIKIWHLATHSSGIEDACVPAASGKPCSEWKKRYWPNRHNEIGFHVSKVEATMAFPPGERFLYSNPAYSNVLAYVMTKALAGTPYSNLRDLLRDGIADELGISENHWTINQGKTFRYDGLDLVTVGGGSDISARAAAKLGQLLVNRGVWEKKRLIAKETIREFFTNVNSKKSTDPNVPKHPKPGVGGWWLNEDGTWTSLPDDAFVGAGGQHAITLVVPSLNLVAVRFGARLGTHDWSGDYWATLEKHFFRPLMDAVDTAHPSTDQRWFRSVFRRLTGY